MIGLPTKTTGVSFTGLNYQKELTEKDQIIENVSYHSNIKQISSIMISRHCI
jgi:hypothetical protein